MDSTQAEQKKEENIFKNEEKFIEVCDNIKL